MKPYPDYQCLYWVYSTVANEMGLNYSKIAGRKPLYGMSLAWRIE